MGVPEDETWPQRYAASLAGIVEQHDQLSEKEIEAMLLLSREVAHQTERRWAPVSTYVAGRFVAERLRGGATVEEAVEQALRIARDLLAEGEQ